MRRIFKSELESDASTGLLVFVGIVLACSALAIGTVMGFELRDLLQREYEKNKPLPIRKSAQNPPPPLISCSPADRQEYARACRNRMRSMQIGGK
jgi:hypothetical protein